MDKRNKQRLLVFVAGAAICLIVLEIALRLVGMIYAHKSESDKHVNAAAANTILSVGDSVTFGIGAPSDLSYPAQLESMLSQSHPQSGYSVINRGWPGQNTTQFLMRFEKYLREFQPDIVTILIGAQNQNNYFGYHDYLNKSAKGSGDFRITLHNWLDTVRVYKFVRLMFKLGPNNQMEEQFREELKAVRERDPQDYSEHEVPECMIGLEYKEKGEYEKALDTILPVASTKEIGAECSNILGSIYREKGQFEEAVKWFKKGIEYDPIQFRNYESIGQVYLDQSRLKEAETWFKRGFEKAQHHTLHPHCYTGINRLFRQSGDIQGAIRFFEKEVQRKPQSNDFLHQLARDYLALFKKKNTMKEIYAWIEADLNKILDLCEKYKAKPVLQNYPFMPEIDFIYRKVAQQREIPFVDHQTTFEPYANHHEFDPDYFVPDGHPNAKGYNLMAKNLWLVLEDIIR